MTVTMFRFLTLSSLSMLSAFATHYRNPGSNIDLFCNTETCTILCDIQGGCEGLSVFVNKEVTNLLHFFCTAEASCKSMYIEANTITTFNLQCMDKAACKYLVAHVNHAQNIDVRCDYNITSQSDNDQGACYKMSIWGRYSANTNVLCNGYASCAHSKLHLEYASSATVIAQGYLPMRYGRIYGRFMNHSLSVLCLDSKSCHSYLIYAQSMSGDVSILCADSRSCDNLRLDAESMSGHLTASCVGDNTCTNIDLRVGTMEGDIDINCHAQTGSIYPCHNAVIEAHDISGNLTVDCTGAYGCSGAQIHCPRDSDCNVICDEVNGCIDAQIHLGDHGLDTIHFDCDDTATSCSALSIHCDSGGQSSLVLDINTTNTWNCIGFGCCPYSHWEYEEIICIADEPCFLTSVGDSNYRGYRIDATNATSLVMNCFDPSSCEGMEVLCPKATGSSCAFNCAGLGSCDDALIEAHAHVDHQINEFTLNCQSRACMRLTAVVNVSTISTVNILCNHVHACDGAHVGITGIVDDAFALDCGAEGGCQNAAFIFETTNIDINCVNPAGSTSNASAACGAADISINGDDLGIVALHCDAYDCSNLVVNVKDAASVNVYCTGESSCRDTSFDLDQSSNVSVFCDGSNSCFDSRVACPSDQIGVCTIDCKDASSCSSLTIAVSSLYVYDYLQWNCHSTDACGSLFIDCDLISKLRRADVTYSYNTTTQKYECVKSDASWRNQYRSCCPTHQGTKVECEADQYCSINCDNSDCNHALIDGQHASFLEVYCGAAYSCSYTAIICPNTGCDVTCGAADAACHWMEVDAPFANVVNVNCSATDSCHRISVNGEYADVVHLYFGITHLLPEWSYEWSYFAMSNAKQVTIDFRGASFANFSDTYIEDRQSSTGWMFHAENASSVTINCLTPQLSVCGTPMHGWSPTDWYLPPSKTTFNCYGYACSGLNLYTIPEDVSAMDINLYSCGQCGSMPQCVDYMIFHCGETYSGVEWVSFDRMATECRTPLWTSQGCGCDALLSNINFYLIEGAQNCSEPITHFTCDMSKDCTLHCDSSQNCEHWIVDGRDARSLSVNCEADYVCQKSFIYCPANGDCEILCNGHSSCRDVKISSNSTVDRGDTVSVRCTGGEYACANMELDAREAAYVVIDTDVYRGFHSGVINANDVHSFILNATHSAHTFSSNKVRIERAKHVLIACHSTNANGGCNSNAMFLPTDPIFQCYGYGCLNLGDIYFEDTSASNNAQWSVNGCGLCNGGSECIYNLNVHCNSYFAPYIEDDYWYAFEYDWYYYNDHDESFKIDFVCNPQTEKIIGIDCGCYDMFHEQMTFINEAQCALPKRTQYPTVPPTPRPSSQPSSSPLTMLPTNAPTQKPVEEAMVEEYSTVDPDPHVSSEPHGDDDGDDDDDDDAADMQLLDTPTLIGVIGGANVFGCIVVVLLVYLFMKRKQKKEINKMMANLANQDPSKLAQRVQSVSSMDPGEEHKTTEDHDADVVIIQGNGNANANANTMEGENIEPDLPIEAESDSSSSGMFQRGNTAS